MNSNRSMALARSLQKQRQAMQLCSRKLMAKARPIASTPAAARPGLGNQRLPGWRAKNTAMITSTKGRRVICSARWAAT